MSAPEKKERILKTTEEKFYTGLLIKITLDL
jgi:hypothetical protein